MLYLKFSNHMAKKFEAGSSSIYKKDTDIDFKNEEFEKGLAEYMVGFIQCYPHLVEKKELPHMPDSELWVFKFWIEDEKREQMLQEYEIQLKKTRNCEEALANTKALLEI